MNVLRVEERLNSYVPAEAVVLSRQDLIACLLAISLLRLSLGAALLRAIICSLWVLAFSLDPAHIFVSTFPSVIPNSELITTGIPMYFEFTFALIK